MAKCNKCGKRGIFFRVNKDRLCKECERISILQSEEVNLKANITNLNKEYLEIKQTRDTLYNQIAEEAKKSAIQEISSQIEKKNAELSELCLLINDKQKEMDTLTDEYNKLQHKIKLNTNQLLKLQALFKSMKYSIEKYFDIGLTSKEILNKNIINEIDTLMSTTVQLKLQFMDIKELRNLYNQNNKAINELLIKYETKYTTKTNAAIYRLMVIALKSELQNILYNLTYSKLDKAIEDVKAMTTKYAQISTDGNQVIAPTITKFIWEIEYLFIEAVKIEYEYYIQKERIKEEQKTIREQMRQEAEERRILEQERKKVEKEEEKFKCEIFNVQQLIHDTSDKSKIHQLEDRIAKLQLQLDGVEKKKEEIITLSNGKAGYIYIISNLGSFGEKVFKIGMTRRQNPQDRVDELGDASVPFRFDVHSMIFSENAPELENNLHKQLHNQRVNKVNLRKEFFNSSVDELENLVLELEPTAEFNRTMLAEQYYQSMAVEKVPESVNVTDCENYTDDED